MSWFIVRDWSLLGNFERKLALLSSYPVCLRRVLDLSLRRLSWWDWHRWNGTAGGDGRQDLQALILAGLVPMRHDFQVSSGRGPAPTQLPPAMQATTET
jgi:hypothetical protein